MAPVGAVPLAADSSGPESLRLRHRLTLLTSHLVVALVALVVIGGATRVMEAGLACPDWPLCYGSLLPGRRMNLQVFLEWFHRLDAFVVGVALLVLAATSLWQRRRLPRWLPWSAALALLLVAIQGGLGALTVLQLLAAGTVTAHLATALLLVLLLSAVSQALETSDASASSVALPRWWSPLVFLAGIPLLSQCLLGGAMASRWAVDRCLQAGEACHWLALHRQVAGPAALSLLLLAAASWCLPAGMALLRLLANAAVVLVAGQVALGIASLRHGLSLPALTIAHQLLAALLVALIGALWGASLVRRPALVPASVVSTTTP